MTASGLRETRVGMASIVSPSGGEDHDQRLRVSSRDDGASIREAPLAHRDAFYHTREPHISLHIDRSTHISKDATLNHVCF